MCARKILDWFFRMSAIAELAIEVGLLSPSLRIAIKQRANSDLRSHVSNTPSVGSNSTYAHAFSKAALKISVSEESKTLLSNSSALTASAAAAVPARIAWCEIPWCEIPWREAPSRGAACADGKSISLYCPISPKHPQCILNQLNYLSPRAHSIFVNIPS